MTRQHSTPGTSCLPRSLDGLAMPSCAGARAVPGQGGIAEGATIYTADGAIAIEWLEPGDRIITRDRGLQTLRRIARLPAAAVPGAVRIARDALGRNRPDRDMVVAPEHRLLMRDARARAIFGCDENFATAASLAGSTGIGAVTGPMPDLYILEFDRHEVIYADGIEVECGRPGNGLRDTRPTLDSREAALLKV